MKVLIAVKSLEIAKGDPLRLLRVLLSVLASRSIVLPHILERSIPLTIPARSLERYDVTQPPTRPGGEIREQTRQEWSVA